MDSHCALIQLYNQMVKIMRKNSLRYIICLSAMTALATACKDSFDIEQLHEPSKLSICCFPSTADTTWIEVTHSISISRGNAPTSDLVTLNAHIIYKVNGEEREVHRVSDERINKNPSIGAARYYVVGPQKPGDHISIEATEQGYQSVSAETTIPQSVPIEVKSLKPTNIYSSEYADFVKFDQLTATFSDPAESADHYALRVTQMHIKGHAEGYADPIYDSWGELYYRIHYYANHYINMQEAMKMNPELEWEVKLNDSIFVYRKVFNDNEPLLNPLSEMDEDFGFESNYYQYFYIFSDESINGETYTLHLNLGSYYSVEEYDFWQQYRVELYRITPEMYRYLKSINDVDNNELAQSGFSTLMPTYSNVHNGIGVVGGFALSKSEWIPKNYY